MFRDAKLQIADANVFKSVKWWWDIKQLENVSEKR